MRTGTSGPNAVRGLPNDHSPPVLVKGHRDQGRITLRRYILFRKGRYKQGTRTQLTWLGRLVWPKILLCHVVHHLECVLQQSA